MTPRIRRLIARIERERRIFENRYLRAARRIARSIRTNSYAAVRLGIDAVETARQSIVGNQRHRGIVPLLADAMLGAYLLGLRRTILETVGAPPDAPPEKDYSTARDWLIAWLAIDAAEVNQLERRFVAMAATAANDLADNIAGMMRRTSGGSGIPPYTPGMAVAAAGEPQRDGLVAIRHSLDARGISADPAHDYAIAGLMTTQILRGYGQGQFAGYSAAQQGRPVGAAAVAAGIVPQVAGGVGILPPVAPGVVRAFRHVSILDERTTEICNHADGTTLAADHPYWLTHWPPLHWNCRSVVVPMYGAFDETEVPDVTPIAGFGNPW